MVRISESSSITGTSISNELHIHMKLISYLYKVKQSDSEVLVMLDLWRMRITVIFSFAISGITHFFLNISNIILLERPLSLKLIFHNYNQLINREIELYEWAVYLLIFFSLFNFTGFVAGLFLFLVSCFLFFPAHCIVFLFSFFFFFTRRSVPVYLFFFSSYFLGALRFLWSSPW